MVMEAEPLAAAISDAKAALGSARVVYLSPQGSRFDQQWAQRLSEEPNLVLLCGRYEGLDERLLQQEVDFELSLGDFVLSGGELAAMVVIDAIARLLPGVLGEDRKSVVEGKSVAGRVGLGGRRIIKKKK